MNLHNIQPVLARMAENKPITDLRSHTYISTYPDILSYANSATPIGPTEFRRLSLMVYGWMPRVLRLDPASFTNAVAAANCASNATQHDYQSINIQAIASCMRSLVGASKLLHFINPNIYAIWDSKIQSFRGLQNSDNSMNKIDNYLGYLDDVHQIASDSSFPAYFKKYNQLHLARLSASGIEKYEVGPLRSIEGAAFELA
ncbi:hypothetical protein ACJJI5_18345 [Microbulbifer sp. EKSA008]|uniref:hypothetical protein n=1 Tax=Microbulbifer sp. EKSA008 TaxID=3243367 RepID=UPI0040431C05